MLDAPPDQLLFVYGSLAPGEVNEHVLAPLHGSWQPGKVRGTLHPEGWGATYGFPAVRLNNADASILGKLFHSSELPSQWDMLDEFEGSAYRREITEVSLFDDTIVKGYIYTLRE